MPWNDFDDEDGEQLPKPQAFAEEDWDGKSILNQPYQGTPEQKALIQRTLAERYAEAAKDDDVKSAQRRATAGNLIGDAFQGLGDYLMADSVARGGPGMKDIRSGVRSANAQRVADAQGARKDRIANVLESDRLTQIEQDRARQKVDQDWQDTERGQKSKQFAIDDAYNDPSSQQSKAIRDQYAQMFPDLAKTSGFENLSANDIKSGLSDPLKIKESMEARKEEAAQRSADRMAMLEGRKSDKADAAAKKEEDYQASVRVPGMEVAPGFRPTAEAAKAVRDAKISKDSITASLDLLDASYKKHGTELIGDEAATQSSYAEAMRMELKNLLRLGALSAGDYASLDRQVPDPTTLGENLKGMAGQSRYAAKSKAFRRSLEEKLKAVASGNGYREAGSSTSENDAVNDALKRSGAGASKGQFPMTVRNPATGKKATVSNADELKEAQAEGYQ